MKVRVGIGVGPDLDFGLTDDFRLVVTKGDDVRLSLGVFNQKRLDFLIECLERLKIHLPGEEQPTNKENSDEPPNTSRCL